MLRDVQKLILKKITEKIVGPVSICIPAQKPNRCPCQTKASRCICHLRKVISRKNEINSF